MLSPAAWWILAALAAAGGGWPQWGGPTRDFKPPAAPISGAWPEGGPRLLWKRDLGFGHSSVVVDPKDRRLYTMYRGGGDEVVIALDARTGRTVWEHRYPAPFLKGMNMDVGSGPHATPLLSGNRLFTAGVTGKFRCLDARTGKLLWQRGLIEELGGTVMARGYSSSPIAYRETVIAMVGGAGHALVAFDQKTGRTVWSRLDFGNSHSSPLLIRTDGQEQLVALMDKIVVGADPANGELLWSHPHDTIGDHTAASPVWGEGNLLFVSSAYNGGSRVIALSRGGGRTEAKELWAHKRMRVHHSNILRIGDFLYGSSGDFGPSFFQAVDVRTGEIRFRDRSFARANLLYAGGQVILLDEDGVLALCSLTPDGIQVHAKAQVLENKAWTPPTLVGRHLYLRDRKTVVALSLP